MIGIFLNSRTTSLKLKDFLSHKFEVTDGLPQGSPVSVILYLIYNLNLLMNSSITLSSQRISLGFIGFWSSPITLMTHDTNMLRFSDSEVKTRHNIIYTRLLAPEKHPTKRILE